MRPVDKQLVVLLGALQWLSVVFFRLSALAGLGVQFTSAQTVVFFVVSALWLVGCMSVAAALLALGRGSVMRWPLRAVVVFLCGFQAMFCLVTDVALYALGKVANGYTMLGMLADISWRWFDVFLSVGTLPLVLFGALLIPVTLLLVLQVRKEAADPTDYSAIPLGLVGRLGVAGGMALSLGSLIRVDLGIPASLLQHPIAYGASSLMRPSDVPRASAPAPWFEPTLTPGSGAQPKHILWVFLESTRARDVAPWNPDATWTPVMAELARDGLVAADMHAMIPRTAASFVTMTCGQLPNLTLFRQRRGPARLPLCLPAAMTDRARYLVTSSVVDFDGLDDAMRFAGFEHLQAMAGDEEWEKLNYFSVVEESMLPPLRAWLDAQGDQPTLAFVVTGAPHHSYDVPTDYAVQELADDPLLSKYRNAVAYQDAFLGQLLALYDETGRRDDTLIVLVGDHGEGLGEHLTRAHSSHIYIDGIHVPFLLSWPGHVAPGVLHGPRSLVDVPSLVAEAAGLQFGPTLGSTSSRADRLVFSVCAGLDQCLSATDARFRYLHHFGDQPDELFDRQADPFEQHDVIAAHPAEAERLRDAAFEFYAAHRARPLYGEP